LGWKGLEELFTMQVDMLRKAPKAVVAEVDRPSKYSSHVDLVCK